MSRKATKESVLAGHASVRALRPHDTVTGIKQPGDEYARPLAEAEQLEKLGVIAIVEHGAEKE